MAPNGEAPAVSIETVNTKSMGCWVVILLLGTRNVFPAWQLLEWEGPGGASGVGPRRQIAALGAEYPQSASRGAVLHWNPP